MENKSLAGPDDSEIVTKLKHDLEKREIEIQELNWLVQNLIKDIEELKLKN